MFIVESITSSLGLIDCGFLGFQLLSHFDHCRLSLFDHGFLGILGHVLLCLLGHEFLGLLGHGLLGHWLLRFYFMASLTSNPNLPGHGFPGHALVDSIWVMCFLALYLNIYSILPWEKHITTIVSTIKRKLALLRRIKWYMPLSTRKLFFNTHILPHIDYCAIIWGNLPHTQNLLLAQRGQLV